MAWDIISIGWIVFVLYWLVSSFFVKKTVKRQRSYGWGIIILLIIILIVLERGVIFPSQYSYFSPVIQTTLFLQITSIMLFISGLLFTIMARMTLGRNWSGIATIKEKHELITNGPYRIVRHPIYTGLLAMLIGTAVYYRTAWAITALVFCFFGGWIKIRTEEKLMTNHFGKEYIEYKKKTKKIIPYII